FAFLFFFFFIFFFFSSRRRHTRSKRDWSSDVCSSDLHLFDDWLRHDLRQPICPPQPVIEQMTIARLRRILRRREYGCLSDRRLRLLLACQRLPNRIAHHHDLLITLLVVLGAPVNRPGLEVDVVPDQVPPR